MYFIQLSSKIRFLFWKLRPRKNQYFNLLFLLRQHGWCQEESFESSEMAIIYVFVASESPWLDPKTKEELQTYKLRSEQK